MQRQIMARDQKIPAELTIILIEMSLLDGDLEKSESDVELGYEETVKYDHPPPELFPNKLWKGTKMSLFFLMWSGICWLPDACPYNHGPGCMYYKLSENTCQLRCKHTGVYGENGVSKTAWCDFQKSWRNFGGSIRSIDNRAISPTKMCGFLYWFSQRVTPEQLMNYVGLKCPRTASTATYETRKIPTQHTLGNYDDEVLGDRVNTAVCVDETYLTVKKKVKGRSFGRRSQANEKIFLGFYELDLVIRKGTRRCHLQIIRDADRVTIEAAIRAKVALGATVWTDGHASYKWLENANSDYDWDTVIHSDRQFSKCRIDGVCISTNSVEGFFSRVKKHLEVTGVTKVKKRTTVSFGEFLWRERYLSSTTLGDDAKWRDFAFWKLLETIQGMTSAKVVEFLGKVADKFLVSMPINSRWFVRPQLLWFRWCQGHRLLRQSGCERRS